jgi:hypothetical protein
MAENVEIRDITFNLKINTESGKVKVEGLTKSFVKTETAIKKMQDALNDVNTDLKGTGVSSGLANTAILEMGRTISDAPYGIQGMGNNLTQLTTILGQMADGVKKGETVIGKLRDAFIGPLGIIVGIQIAIAAFEIFRKSQKKATDAVKEFNAEAILQGRTLQELRRAFLDSEGPVERRLMLLKSLAAGEKNLQKILESKNLTEEEQIALADEYIRKVILLEDKEKELLQAKKDIEDVNKDINISEEQIIKNNEAIANILELQDRKGYNRDLNQTRVNLEKENEIIKESLSLLSQLGSGLAYVANEREAAVEQATQRTNYIFLSPEETKEQEKVFNDNLKVFNSYIQKAKELRAENEIAALESQRAYEISSLSQGENYNKAKQAINDYYDELIKQKEKENAEEAIKLQREVAEKKRESDLKVFLNRSNHNIRMADLEAKLADKRLREILKTEKEQLDSDIRVAESRVKVLRILATTSESAQRSLDEVLIVLDDLRKRRNNIIEEEGARLEDYYKMFTAISSGIRDLLASEAEREIAIETNKTNKINDQLRQRLANEQLAADERDKINQQIARNEAALVAKENAINKKRFNQQKAFNIAIAIVDTYVAANKALKDETIPNSFARIAAMVSIITTGLANVATISRQKFQAKAMPSPNLTSQGGIGEGLGAPSFNIVGASGRNQLAEAIAGSRQEPIKAYVVSSDVSTAQELDRKIVEGASI